MPALGAGIHVFAALRRRRRGWPGHPRDEVPGGGHDDVGWFRASHRLRVAGRAEVGRGISHPSCPRSSRASTSLQPYDAEDVGGRDTPGTKCPGAAMTMWVGSGRPPAACCSHFLPESRCSLSGKCSHERLDAHERRLSTPSTKRFVTASAARYGRSCSSAGLRSTCWRGRWDPSSSARRYGAY
jgi:hypothetical protein